MKKLISLLFILLPPALFAQTNNVFISIKIANPPNINQLYLIIGENIDSTYVKNGEASFQEKIEHPLMGHLAFKKFQGREMLNRNNYKQIYLTPGKLIVSINNVDSIFMATVSGNKLSTTYDEKLLMPVQQFNRQINQLRGSFISAKIKSEPDTAQLKIQIDKQMLGCYQVPQEFIKANPNSPLAIVALNMLGIGGHGTPISVHELTILYNSLSTEIKNTDSGIAYASKLTQLNDSNSH